LLAADEGADVAGQRLPVLLPHIHHVAAVIIGVGDAVLRDAGAAERIFRREEGRREIIIALRVEDGEAAVFPQGPADIGGDVEVELALANVI
jgi:hypothetical protein